MIRGVLNMRFEGRWITNGTFYPFGQGHFLSSWEHVVLFDMNEKDCSLITERTASVQMTNLQNSPLRQHRPIPTINDLQHLGGKRNAITYPKTKTHQPSPQRHHSKLQRTQTRTQMLHGHQTLNPPNPTHLPHNTTKLSMPPHPRTKRLQITP